MIARRYFIFKGCHYGTDICLCFVLERDTFSAVSTVTDSTQEDRKISQPD